MEVSNEESIVGWSSGAFRGDVGSDAAVYV
jgi:hypothetical protein